MENEAKKPAPKKKRSGRKNPINPETGKPVIGRPTKFDAVAAEKILERHAEGESLTSLCKEFGIKFGTFMGWIYDDRENLSERYSRAQFANAAANVNYAFEIADDGRNDYMTLLDRDGNEYQKLNREVIQRSDLRVKFRQWYAEKVFSGALKYKPGASANSDDSSAARAAVEALERLAREKAATAKAA